MPHFSFDKCDNAKAVAIVKGGRSNGEILYIVDDPLKGGRRPKATIKRDKYKSALKGTKPIEKTKIFAMLEDSLQRDITPEKLTGVSDEVRELYKEIITDMSDGQKVELDNEGMFELLPPCDPLKRSVWYVCGQSGAGKSFIAKGLLDYYHKLFPDRGCYLISELKADETLDTLDFLKRIPIQSFVDDYPELDECKDCIICVDDFDNLKGDSEKVVQKFIDDICIMGRHSNTTILILTHRITDYKKTKIKLAEATNVVVFPQSTSITALKYLCTNYVGVDDDSLKMLKKLGSRWISFSKGYPIFAVAQKDAIILNS